MRRTLIGDGLEQQLRCRVAPLLPVAFQITRSNGSAELTLGHAVTRRTATIYNSERHDAIVVHDELRVAFGIDEFGVLSTEIGFGDPTGLRAPASHVDSDASFDRELQQILQRRDGEAREGIAHL